MNKLVFLALMIQKSIWRKEGLGFDTFIAICPCMGKIPHPSPTPSLNPPSPSSTPPPLTPTGDLGTVREYLLLIEG